MWVAFNVEANELAVRAAYKRRDTGNKSGKKNGGKGRKWKGKKKKDTHVHARAATSIMRSIYLTHFHSAKLCCTVILTRRAARAFPARKQ